MNMNLLYIGNDLVDLAPGTVIAQTLKRNEVGDLTARSVSFTSTFRFPFTPTNNRIYQHANKVNSESTLPYQKQTAKLVQNGIETIQKGVHYLRQVSESYEAYILHNVADFFDQLGNKTLNDLDFEGVNGSWEDGDIENYRNTSSGVVAPVMDYGNFTPGTPAINVSQYLPSVYYKTIIDKIFEQAGYDKSGTVFSNAKYLKQIIAYSRTSFSYGSKFANDRSASATVVTPQSIPTPGTGVKVIFSNTVIQDPKGFWDGSDDYTPIDADTNANNKVLFGIDVLITIDITVAGGTVDIILNLTGFGTYISLTNKGTGVHTINSKDLTGGDVVAAVEGQSLSVQIATNSGTPSVTVNAGSVVFNCSGLPIVNSGGFGSGSFVYFNELLPDMLQRDFMKDFMVSFGLLPSESGNTVVFKSLNEIIRDKANAKNWTSKRVRRPDRIRFTPLEYAQTNYFKYDNQGDTFDHNGTEIEINGDLGTGSFDLSNDNIANEKTIYTSPFNNTLTELYGGIMMARIPINGSRLAFENEPGLRKLLVRDKYSFEPNVVYLGPSFNDYLVAYFDSPDEDFTMRWDQFLNDHYSDLIASLNKAKVITRSYTLSTVDIITIDFFTPIFDTDGYYLVNEVKGFVPGNVTDVELLKTI